MNQPMANVNPVAATRIALFRPVVCEEAVQGAAAVLRSGWLGLGPRTVEFERAFAAYVGAPYCVGLNSATSALHLAVKLLDLPEGSEIITTPVTFVSTNHAILYERHRPVFADVEPTTGNLDVASIRRKITERTRAIMVVHVGGYPCDLDEVYALAQKHNLPVIEDCAHAAGASYKGRRIGSHGGQRDVQCYSFHAVKNLPMGDGGAVVTRNEASDARLRRLRWLGIDADTYSRTGRLAYKWEYDVPEVGYKYHMNDIQAAIGIAQLARLDQDNSRRRAIAERYHRELAGVAGVQVPQYRADRQSSYHLALILAERRNALADKLRAEGIDTGVHYRRNDEFPMYEKQDLPKLPGVAWYVERAMSLPLHLQLTDDQVGTVIAAIRRGW
jgi:perosamine synthetase